MTKKKFLTYVKIQESGKTNMMDLKTVCNLSRGQLTKDDCIDIQHNYESYVEEFIKKDIYRKVGRQ